MTPELNVSDLTILIEAIEAWENKDLSGEIFSTVFGAMLLPKDDEVARAKFEREGEERRAKQDAARQERKEQGTILRAKLFQLRQAQREAEFNKTFAPAI